MMAHIMEYKSSFLYVFSFVGLRDNNLHVHVLLVDIEEILLGSICFPDGGFNEVAIYTIVYNIRVDLSGYSVSLFL